MYSGKIRRAFSGPDSIFRRRRAATVGVDRSSQTSTRHYRICSRSREEKKIREHTKTTRSNSDSLSIKINSSPAHVL